MEIVDVRGLSCPIPVIRTKKVLDQGVSELLVLGDSSVSKENVGKLAGSSGYTVTMKVDEINNWEMEIKK
ncbi:MAG TPA: sulfurtransferase TusA family protein [Syntrophomonadaceae bacterium]|nr:sulfurtransferase TusA family protein [Syntrophomonadaceae bacterium]